jgi:hypothetical protein
MVMCEDVGGSVVTNAFKVEMIQCNTGRNESWSVCCVLLMVLCTVMPVLMRSICCETHVICRLGGMRVVVGWSREDGDERSRMGSNGGCVMLN